MSVTILCEDQLKRLPVKAGENAGQSPCDEYTFERFVVEAPINSPMPPH